MIIRAAYPAIRLYEAPCIGMKHGRAGIYPKRLATCTPCFIAYTAHSISLLSGLHIPHNQAAAKGISE